MDFWYTQKQILLSDTSDERRAVFLGFWPSFWLICGTGLLGLFFSSLILSSLGFFLKIPLSDFHLGAVSALCAIILYFFAGIVLKPHFGMTFALVVLLLAASAFVSVKIGGSFYDLSYDGQSYHQETIIALSQGWIPFYAKLSPEKNPDISYQKLLNSYPKGSELLEAVIYKASHRIEEAKALILLLGLTAFSLAFSFFLRTKINPFVSLLGSFLLVVSPITVTQSLNFYLDGQLYLLLLSLVFLLAGFFLTHKNYFLLPLVMGLTILWNMKLTAVFTSVLILAGFLVFVWYSEKILLFFKSLQGVAIAAVLAFLVVGFNPYITNFLWFGNPFYPTMGKNSSDYITVNMPSSFYKKSSPERFILSLFSQSSNARGVGKTYVLKWPFSYSEPEINSFTGNVTVGGFGPLFSGIFILSFFGIISIIFIRGEKLPKRAFWFLSFIILASSMLVPVSSYARFIPQLWAVPVLAVIFLLTQKSFLQILIGSLLLLAISYNLFLIGGKYYRFNWEKTSQMKNELSKIKEVSQKSPLMVDFGVFRSNRIRFQEAGIAFTEGIKGCAGKEKRVLASEIPESLVKICY